jgi:hypothetical protein
MAKNGRNGWEEGACARTPPGISHKIWLKKGSLTAKKKTKRKIPLLKRKAG